MNQIKEPPCRSCKYQDQSKNVPFIWTGKIPKDRPARDMIYIPGLNKPNPCYKCRRCMDYADWIAGFFICGPTTGDVDAVAHTEISR